MPQVTKGGKYIFGWSRIGAQGRVRVPPMAREEYDIACEGRVYLIAGTAQTGGVILTRHGLLAPSQLGHILQALPQLAAYQTPPGALIRYKGRQYSWVPIQPDGAFSPSPQALEALSLLPGQLLLSIRSSDIAFTMGVRGQLIERARASRQAIPVYA